MNDEDMGWSGAGWLVPASEPITPAEQETDKVLKYHDKQMNPEPINVTLAVVAAELLKGHPALAILEPGDATRYELVLVSCWSSNIRLGLASHGIRPSHTAEYLLCVKINGIQTSFFATQHVQEYDVEGVGNGWTARFLAWWLRQLWVEINKGR